MENPMENPEHKAESFSALSARIRREFRAETLSTAAAVRLIRPPGQTEAGGLLCPLCGYAFSQSRPIGRYLAGDSVECTRCRKVFSWRGEIFQGSKLSPNQAVLLLMLLEFRRRPPGMGEIAAAVGVADNTARFWRDAR